MVTLNMLKSLANPLCNQCNQFIYICEDGTGVHMYGSTRTRVRTEDKLGSIWQNRQNGYIAIFVNDIIDLSVTKKWLHGYVCYTKYMHHLAKIAKNAKIRTLSL